MAQEPAVQMTRTPRYAGATIVSLALWWAGWIAGVGGTLVAIGAAAEYGGDAFLILLLGSWLSAASFFWFAYMLRLISDVEMHLRR
jgi:uncharacterized membrane protein YphA (DoxX/SURF4 family)